MTTANWFLALLGRLLLAAIFLMSAFGKITDFPGTAEEMTREGIVLAPILLVGALVVELAGALLLLFVPRWGALLLFLFLIPVTLIYHDFWQYTGGEAKNQMFHFLKNIAIMGGLLVVMAFPRRSRARGAEG